MASTSSISNPMSILCSDARLIPKFAVTPTTGSSAAWSACGLLCPTWSMFAMPVERAIMARVENAAVACT